MNKTANTILFVLAATVANIAIMLTIVLVPAIILIAVFREGIQEVFPFVFMVLVSGGFIGGFFVYNLILNFVRKKIDLEKYIHPILSGKRKALPKDDTGYHETLTVKDNTGDKK